MNHRPRPVRAIRSIRSVAIATIAALLATLMLTSLASPASASTTPSTGADIRIVPSSETTTTPPIVVGADTSIDGGPTAYAPSDSCRTTTETAYGDNRVGAHLTSFTLTVWYCVHKSSTTLGPVYHWVYKIISAWNGTVVDQHLSHKVFSLASTAGWSYVGLDDTGNWGPTLTSGGGLTVQRRAHFHLHFGFGAFALNQDGYLTVHLEIGPTGGVTTYTSANT